MQSLMNFPVVRKKKPTIRRVFGKENVMSKKLLMKKLDKVQHLSSDIATMSQGK